MCIILVQFEFLKRDLAYYKLEIRLLIASLVLPLKLDLVAKFVERLSDYE